MSLRPTSEISRFPRSLDEIKNFKANEFRALLLYYIPICAKGIQKTEYLRHFQLLSSAVYTLLGTDITTQKLNESRTKLSLFVKDFQIIYEKTNMVMNVHLLNHLTDACINLGPLWSQSAFAFEDFNSVLLNYVKGSTDVLLQISSKYVLDKCYVKNHIKNCSSDGIVLLGRPKRHTKSTACILSL
jgi:hypothetical protein